MELNMCRVSPSRGCGGCFGPGRCGRAAKLALRDRLEDGEDMLVVGDEVG
jgi:hypothetical protein